MNDDKGAVLRALHVKGDPFVLANAWDAGSAKALAALGAKAIGTSSAALAFSQGRQDMGDLTRKETLSHARAMVEAVNVPVSGDFENGFGHDGQTVAETVRMAADIGLAGISIEDMALPDTVAYARGDAIGRIEAAAKAARGLRQDFVLCARADGVMNGVYDLDEALARIKGYEAAGADCVYVPVPGGLAEQEAVITATGLPVNVLITGGFCDVPRESFALMGAARLSLGSSLSRRLWRTLVDIGHDMFDRGDFTALGHTMAGGDIEALLHKGPR